MENKWKILVFIVIIALLIYGYVYEQNKSNVVENPKYSKQELLEFEIEELKEKNSELEEEVSALNHQLDDLKNEYEYDEELIYLLKDQLKTLGVEPYEL